MIRNKQTNPRIALATPPGAVREASALLRAKGKRITGQRALLLRTIAESDVHLDAAELYRRARRRNPRLNLATVYRTLNLLKESGLVEPRHLTHAERHEHFESKPSVEHHHFTCLACGRVIEFQSTLVERLRAQVKREFGVEFTPACLCLEGYCAECARQRRD